MKRLFAWVVAWLSVGLPLLSAEIATAPPDASSPPRLVLMAVDSAQPTCALADLLTASLSTQSWVQLVERMELDKVMSEQKLNASGLVEWKNRVLLGRLLRANGFLFIQRDAHKPRLLVRLVEARQGFQVCQWQYAMRNRQVPDLLGDITVELSKSVSKLRLNPADCLLVSILRIGNGTLSSDYFWIEDEMPMLLGMYLSQDPRVLVLERRQLQDLLTEREVTADTVSTFLSAGVILDGDISLTPGAKISKASPSVTFTMRFRKADHATIASIALDGALTNLNDLAARTMQATLAKLREIGPQASGETVDESRLFLNLAQKQGVVWAAEAARALDVTNEAALITLVTTLAKKGFSSVSSRTSEQQVREQAEALARAADLCQASGSDKVCRLLTLSGVQHNPGGLLREKDGQENDKEINEMLHPVRQIIRLQAEKNYLAFSEKGVEWHLGEAMQFFDDPFEHLDYIRAMLDRLLTKKDWSELERIYYAAVVLRNAHYYGPWAYRKEVIKAWRRMYQEMTGRNEPIIQFMAWAKLTGIAEKAENQQQYALQALKLVDQVLNHEKMLSMSPRREQDNLFIYQISDLLKLCPEEKPRFDLQVKTAFSSMIEGGKLDISRGNKLLYLLPPDEAVRQIDRALELHSQGKITNASPDYVQSFIVGMKKERANLTRSAQPETMAGKWFSRQLLTVDTPWLKDLISGPSQRWNWNDEKGPGCLSPFRMLLDGSNLWVALGGNRDSDGVGLAQIELPSGAIKSLQIGDVLRRHKQRIEGADTFIAYDILCVSRWNNIICVSQSDVGIHLFPTTTNPNDHSLMDVPCLTEKDGLLDRRVRAAIGVGDDLFLGHENALVKWNCKKRETTFVSQPNQQLYNNDGKDHIIIGLLADPTGQYLYVLIGSGSVFSAQCDIWKMNIKNGDWSKLHENILEKNPPRIRQRVVMVNNHTWALLAREGNIHSRLIFEFDAATERLSIPDKNAAVSVYDLELLPWGAPFDVMAYDNGAIAIIALENKWAVQFFTRETTSRMRVEEWRPDLAAKVMPSVSTPKPTSINLFK